MYDRDVNGDVTYSVKLDYRACHSCEREYHRRFLVDDLCPQCRQEEPEPLTPERRRENKRNLFKSAAQVLRKIGHPDRAEWYEKQIAALDAEDRGDAA